MVAPTDAKPAERIVKRSDQPALAALFDIEQARRADSFDKCYRDIVRLLDELRKTSGLTSEQT